MIKLISIFEKKIQIKFKNKNFLNKALTHKSSHQTNNNEKLEFLGDRVIGLILSRKLIDLYPNENEGILDKRFSKLVNRTTCSYIAWSIEMQNYIILGDLKKKVTQKDEKILSDACEALVGAVYLDQGFEIVEKFVLKLWKSYLDKSNITVLDSKTKLQEYSLKKFKKLPVYNLISSSGPKHNPIFKISVSIQGAKSFNGSGKSKQTAQQNAAKKLLNYINPN
jgi:ribonuclease III